MKAKSASCCSRGLERGLEVVSADTAPGTQEFGSGYVGDVRTHRTECALRKARLYGRLASWPVQSASTSGTPNLTIRL